MSTVKSDAVLLSYSRASIAVGISVGRYDEDRVIGHAGRRRNAVGAAYTK